MGEREKRREARRCTAERVWGHYDALILIIIELSKRHAVRVHRTFLILLTLPHTIRVAVIRLQGNDVVESTQLGDSLFFDPYLGHRRLRSTHMSSVSIHNPLSYFHVIAY